MHRIALVPYTHDWTYESTAIAVQRHLAPAFECRIFHRETLGNLRPHEFDLLVDFWWGGTLHRKCPRPVAKQVSSHRWMKPQHGTLKPLALAALHLRKNTAVFVPSELLHRQLAPVSAPPVMICPKGFEPESFGDASDRRGELVVGWAGNANAADKNVALLQRAWPELVAVGDGTPLGRLEYSAMGAWYNTIDVITCASDAEGDPRSLIEGMACGCFPVTVDVGIVPELVRHGENGLIVERSAQAFADAFAWCRANLEQVREAGRRNAREMLASRTWAQASRAWGAAFERAIAIAG